MELLNLYWGCLTGGVLFALVTIIFGDVLGDILDGALEFLTIDGLDIFQPMVLVGGITAFGGAGIMLTRYTSLQPLAIGILALLIAVFLSLVVYFMYVKPMKNTENSTAFSLQDLSGSLAEVIVTIPAQGYGEVMLKVGAGNTNQIAASLEGPAIPIGTKVVVGAIKEDILYVFPYNEN